MEPRDCQVVGLGLSLVGGLATVAGLVRSGAFGVAVMALAATGSVLLALSNLAGREPFDIEPTLAHRVASWGGAVLALALGVLLLGIGVVSVVGFG